MARLTRLSEWLDQVHTNPNARSPHWQNWTEDHGFYGANITRGGKPAGSSFVGYDLTRGNTKGIGKRMLDSAVEKYDFGNKDDHFVCWAKDAKYVKEVWYDRNNMVMKVLHEKSRTMMRGASCEGNVSIYTHVPLYAFESLKEINANIGHVGRLFWDRFRVRGTLMASHYPYIDRED